MLWKIRKRSKGGDGAQGSELCSTVEQSAAIHGEDMVFTESAAELPISASPTAMISDLGIARRRGRRMGYLLLLLLAGGGVAAVPSEVFAVIKAVASGNAKRAFTHETRMNMQWNLREYPWAAKQWVEHFGNVSDEFSRKKLTPKQVAWLVKMEGFPERAVDTMVCIAVNESAMRPSAMNRNRDGSKDIGLFQINELWLAECGGSRKALLNPVVNTKCALKVWQAHGFDGWIAFRKHATSCRSYDWEGQQQLASR